MASTEKLWFLPPAAASHELPGDIPTPIARTLVSRGIDTAEKLAFFLDPPQQLPYNPLRMSGMERALQRLFQAIQQKERVGVFGDFDVDGITGTAILCEGLQDLSVPVVPYLPHRVGEGHGLSHDAVQRLVEQGVSLIVTVDCGVTSVAEVAEARNLGSDVIITDHHTPPPDPPDAVAILNPRMEGSQYPFGDLCGAGIAFKLMQGLYQYYGQPWNPALLELAALGTIADLVPLQDENRYLVREGLTELALTRRPGLQALYRLARVDSQALNAETIAFQIAPRLNSAGRMSHAKESLQLLLTRSEFEAEELAQRLEELNQDRRELTEQAFSAACQQVEQQEPLPPILVVGDPTITPGVAGLVAGRLVERHHRPAVVMASVDEEHIVASGRSIPQFNLVQAFTTCQDLFVRFGGHSQAAGFTLQKEKIPFLRDRLTAVAHKTLTSVETQATLSADAELNLSELTPGLLNWLRQLEPFGVGNPQPRFLIRGLQVVEARNVGQLAQHLRLQVRQGRHQGTALAFNQAEKWVKGTAQIDIVSTISIDSWNGAETITMKVADFRSSEV